MAYVPPLNGGRINASISGNTAGVSTLISTGTMVLAGGNNIVLSQNGNSITISGSNAAAGSINFSASNTSANLASVTFSNSNGVSFGLNGGVITASHNALTSQSNQTLGMYAAGNTTQNTSQTIDARNLTFNGLGAMTVGYSGSSVQLSAPVASSVSATGIVSISTNGNTVSIGAPAYSAGISSSAGNSTTFGNTAGSAGMATNRLVFAGGNNITLSQVTSSNGNTLTISGPPMFHAGVLNSAAGGSTSGTMGSNYTGGMVLYAGSNIGLSQSTDASSNASVTIMASGGGGGGVAVVNGASTYSSGSVNLNASGALTINNTGASSLNFSVPATSSLAATGAVSISTNGSTISIGAPLFDFGIGGTNTLGNTSTVSNGLQLVGGNNITLSQATDTNGATVTISGNAGGGGGGLAISGGGALYSTGTLNLNASGALTIASTAGTALNLSVPGTSSLVGVNGITVTSAGNVISISGNGGAGGGVVSNWEPFQLQGVQIGSTVMSSTNLNTVFFNKLEPMGNVSASLLMQMVNMSVSTSSNSSHAGALSAYAGIYSANGATLSLITQSSGSFSYSWNVTSNNGSSNLNGIRGINIPMTVNMNAGNYWLGLLTRTTFSNIQNFTLSHMYISSNTSFTYAGTLGQAANITQGLQEGVGYYSSSTTALPTAVPMSSIIQSNLRSYFMPYLAFKNTTW